MEKADRGRSWEWASSSRVPRCGSGVRWAPRGVGGRSGGMRDCVSARLCRIRPEDPRGWRQPLRVSAGVHSADVLASSGHPSPTNVVLEPVGAAIKRTHGLYIHGCSAAEG